MGCTIHIFVCIIPLYAEGSNVLLGVPRACDCVAHFQELLSVMTTSAFTAHDMTSLCLIMQLEAG